MNSNIHNINRFRFCIKGSFYIIMLRSKPTRNIKHLMIITSLLYMLNLIRINSSVVAKQIYQDKNISLKTEV